MTPETQPSRDLRHATLAVTRADQYLADVNDSIDLVVKLLPIVSTIATALVTVARGSGVLRTRLRHDVEIVKDLPDSSARASLLTHINNEIAALVAYDKARRDLPMLIVALALAPTFGYLASWLILVKGEWWALALGVVCAVASVVFLYGIFEAGERVPRDTDRNRIAPSDLGPTN